MKYFRIWGFCVFQDKGQCLKDHCPLLEANLFLIEILMLEKARRLITILQATHFLCPLIRHKTHRETRERKRTQGDFPAIMSDETFFSTNKKSLYKICCYKMNHDILIKFCTMCSGPRDHCHRLWANNTGSFSQPAVHVHQVLPHPQVHSHHPQVWLNESRDW